MNERVYAGIERELRALLPAGEPLRIPVEYALRGGKRARGVLLAATGEGEIPESALCRAAASLELLHAATLVQDDIFDRSRIRRGRAAAHCVFGAQVATLASDWMLAEAIRSAYRLKLEFGEALSGCAQAVIAGEAREFTSQAWENLPELRAAVARVARSKTGELFGLAFSAPALLRGDLPSAGRLHEAGCALGIAFQYLDDAADLYGEARAAGKDLRRDGAAGLVTLPMLDALRMMPGPARRLWPRAGSPLPTSLLEAIAEGPVRERVLRCARSEWRDAVEGVVRELPNCGPARSVLAALAGKVLTVAECEAGLSAA